MAVIERLVEVHCPSDQVPEDWDLQAIVDHANGTFLYEGQTSKDKLWGKETEEIRID